MSEKITERHLARKAIVYIRQSSPYQVAHNTESRRLQYAMRDRIQELGWLQVEFLDEDLGRSASGTTARAGFERMVAEVCLGNIGAIAARELSRFARNSRDWQKLMEVCRVVDTLLIDQETVYDTRRSNDRLLLGLKGSLNEYELDLLRQRAWEARREKACRGELVASIPTGFVKTALGTLELDPDRRVQEAIRLVFRKFFELGTARQLHLWLLEQGLKFPARVSGLLGWETHWKRPTYPMIHRVLTNPAYAGAYAYGRTQVLSEFREGQPCKTIHRKARADWHSLIPGHHEGYIEWEEFERVQRMLAQNARRTETTPGAAKHGPALLAGILRCRRCGRKMTVQYTGRCHDVLRYTCCRGYLDNAEPRCITFGGLDVDRVVSRELLRVVQPAAVEAAVSAGQQASSHQDDVLGALHRDLEAARYAADRAQKQYDLTDPENRLVVDELERRWNAALQHVRELEQRIADEVARRRGVAPPETGEFRELACDLHSVWNDPHTDVRLKKRLLRTLIHEVIADLNETAGQILLVIHWQGGVHTELQVRRRRRGQNRTHTAHEIVDAVRELVHVGTDTQIAGWLNRHGLRTGRGNRWTKERVGAFRSWHKIACYTSKRQQAEGWLTLLDAARIVGVSHTTLRLAVERGEVKAMHPLPNGPWIFQRDALNTPQVQALVRRAQCRQRCAAPKSGQHNLDFSGT